MTSRPVLRCPCSGQEVALDLFDLPHEPGFRGTCERCQGGWTLIRWDPQDPDPGPHDTWGLPVPAVWCSCGGELPLKPVLANPADPRPWDPRLPLVEFALSGVCPSCGYEWEVDGRPVGDIPEAEETSPRA
jgi:hypothetical protein